MAAPPRMTVVRKLAGETATIALGAELALFARPGISILLKGDLGTGKSTLARALVRALAPADGDFDVPSPTFTLVQSYDFTRVPVVHADLYRIGHAEEMEELGLGDLLDSHLLIVEWPDRMREPPGPDRIEITLDHAGRDRIARLDGHGACKAMLARIEAACGFLAGSPWSGANRRYLQGDASYRRYERLRARDGRTAVLMDMPKRPPEPVIRDDRSYSDIARRAEGIAAVAAINRHLIGEGYSAPAVHEIAIAQGFAVIEDFGDLVFGAKAAKGDDMSEPLQTAAALLADMASRDWPGSVPVAPGVDHMIPSYDLDALTIEVETLPDWFWPLVKPEPIPPVLRAEFLALWTEVLADAGYGRRHWVLRDVHSPNLIWLPWRRGLQRVGLIDTQDCVLGHPAYDLASLLQDARATIAPDVADGLFDCYCTCREPRFRRDEFESAFVLFGAQRAAKILGIFARLAQRDGKRHYLHHVPRVSAYLERNLRHPILAPLRRWFARHLPHEVRISRS